MTRTGRTVAALGTLTALAVGLAPVAAVAPAYAVAPDLTAPAQVPPVIWQACADQPPQAPVRSTGRAGSSSPSSWPNWRARRPTPPWRRGPGPRWRGVPKAAGYGEPVEDAFSAVFCQDWRLPVRSFPELDLYRRALSYVASDMKLSPLGWSATLSCQGWPARVGNPQHRLQVHGAPPILMLNSRYDPATPYEWATAAAHQMGAVLLTYDGWGHGSYFKGSTCVTGATDTYFITGKTPKRGTHCPGVEPPIVPGASVAGPAPAPFPLPGRPAWIG